MAFQRREAVPLSTSIRKDESGEKNEPASPDEFQAPPESPLNAHTTKKRRGRIERWQRFKDTRRNETGVQNSFHRTILGSRSAQWRTPRREKFHSGEKNKNLLAHSAHRTDFPNWGGGGSIIIKQFSSSFLTPLSS